MRKCCAHITQINKINIIGFYYFFSRKLIFIWAKKILCVVFIVWIFHMKCIDEIKTVNLCVEKLHFCGIYHFWERGRQRNLFMQKICISIYMRLLLHIYDACHCYSYGVAQLLFDWSNFWETIFDREIADS